MTQQSLAGCVVGCDAGLWALFCPGGTQEAGTWLQDLLASCVTVECLV